MKFIKALKSRTVWLGILIMGLSTAQGYVNFLPTTPFYQMLMGILLGAIVIVLRFKTTGSIDDK